MTEFLSPRDLANAVGASESSLKRWVDEGVITAIKTAGGHRRISVPEAVRFIRGQRSDLIHPELLGVPDLGAWKGPAPQSGDEQTAALMALLQKGDERAARALIARMYLDGVSIAEIVDGPISTAMHEFGKLWKTDERGIYLEHRATDICISGVNYLRSLLMGADDAPAAVGGAPAGDPYILPSLMAAATLEDTGFRAMNLGGDMPTDSLLRAANDTNAVLVWLSISSVRGRAALEQSINELASALDAAGRTLALGGRALNALSLPSGPHVFVGKSMQELSGFATALRGAERVSGVTKD